MTAVRFRNHFQKGDALIAPRRMSDFLRALPPGSPASVLATRRATWQRAPHPACRLIGHRTCIHASLDHYCVCCMHCHCHAGMLLPEHEVLTFMRCTCFLSVLSLSVRCVRPELQFRFCSTVAAHVSNLKASDRAPQILLSEVCASAVCIRIGSDRWKNARRLWQRTSDQPRSTRLLKVSSPSSSFTLTHASTTVYVSNALRDPYTPEDTRLITLDT